MAETNAFVYKKANIRENLTIFWTTFSQYTLMMIKYDNSANQIPTFALANKVNATNAQRTI